MNSITVKITAPLRRFTNGQSDVGLHAASVHDALGALCDTHPDLRARILGEDGAPREFINIFVGKKNIRALDGLQTRLAGGDVLSIASPFSGG
jgi:molybdopterin synthase sulfur carrier subunit